VDSDSGGTTDPVHIGNVLKTREPIVIFATYDSFFGLLTQEFGEYLTDNSAFLLVDEMHNLTPAHCRVVNEYHTSLLMSATVPEELKGLLDATEVYRYTMATGIADGFLCDYEVYLPLVKCAVPTPTKSEDAARTTSAGSAKPDDGGDGSDENDNASDDDDENDAASDNDLHTEDEERERTAADVEFPVGFPANDITAKALFLCTGMLQTGSRRCIVYLRSSEECVLFNRMLQRVCEEYHGLRLWNAHIDYTVGAARRSEMLRAFQLNSDEHDLFVIASVRILDEAVDIPRCDSEFITYMGDRTSDIRTVQRLQRGGRLDPSNHAKKNNLFIWTDEWSHALNSLTIMRQEDPMFHKKLRVLSCNYDRHGEPAVQRESRAHAKELQAYMELKCLTLNELWMKRVNERCKWYNKLGREPSKKSHDKNESHSARWVMKQRNLKSAGRLGKEREDILIKCVGWKWKISRTFKESLQKRCDWYNTLGREPKRTSPNKDEASSGRWVNAQRNLKKKGTLGKARVDILSACVGWKWTTR